MGLTGWSPPSHGILIHAPRPPTLKTLLREAPIELSAKLEALCDVLYNIEPMITPELVKGARLRPFVHCWMGAHLRFWDERLARFGRSNKIDDALCRAVIKVGLAGDEVGAAEAWLRTSGIAVRAQFNLDNIKLTALPGGVAGLESVVETLENVCSSVSKLCGTVANHNTTLNSEVVRLRLEIIVIQSQFSQCKADMARLGQQQLGVVPEMAASAAATAAAAASAPTICKTAPNLGGSAVASPLNMDTLQSVGHVMAVLAKHSIAEPKNNSRTNVNANNTSRAIKARSYMRAVATTDENASGISLRDVSVVFFGVAAAASVAGGAAAYVEPSFLCLSIELEARVQMRLWQEEQ